MSGILASLLRSGTRGLAAVPAALCAQVLEVTGIAVSVLMSGGAQEMLWRTDGVSAQLDDLQFTLGEGPVVDVAASGELVLEPELSAVPWQRWPVFTPAALELGARALFAVPLQIGAVRLGVLLAYREMPGPLGAAALEDLLVFAEAVTEALLGRGGAGSPQWPADLPSGYRAQIHQATGMISVQLSVTQAEALIRLRAHAFSQRRSLAEVAADVVARRLRFDADT